MTQQRASVRNAASPQQVQRAERKAKEELELFQAAVAAVMATPAGRIVMWGLLSRANVFGSIWSPNAEIHYRAGRQDFGHELIDILTSVDDTAYMTMEAEARARTRKKSTEIEALNTPTAEEQRNG